MRIFLALMLAVLSSPAHAETQRIAVIEFIGTAPSDVLMDITDEARLGVLDATKGHAYSIMTKESMVAMARDQGIDLSKCTAAECEVDTGRAIGAHFVITGKLSGSDGRYKIMMKVFNTDTAAVLAGDTFRVEALTEVEDTMRSFTARVTADALQLGKSASAAPGVALDPSVTGEVEVTTGSGTDYAALAARAVQAKAIREQREAELAEQDRIAAAAREAERQRLAEQERQAQAALAAERERRVDVAKKELIAKAGSDYDALRPLISMDVTPETRPVLEQFVKDYDKAAVRIDGKVHTVEVPGVAEVQQALARPVKSASAPKPERTPTGAKPAPSRSQARTDSGGPMKLPPISSYSLLSAGLAGAIGLVVERKLAEDVRDGGVSDAHWEEQRNVANVAYIAAYSLTGLAVVTGVTSVARNASSAQALRGVPLTIGVSGAW